MKTPQEILTDYIIMKHIINDDHIIHVQADFAIEAMETYAKQFYTQEQLLAFGDSLTKRFNELALHERSWADNERKTIYKDSDGTQEAWFHAYGLGITKAQKLLEQTLIDISKLLNK